jgi:sugar transferase EpsL
MYEVCKRLFDLVVIIPLLILTSPLLLTLAVWIRVESKGSAIFKQQRAGKNGKPFTLYKFRSMRTDVDPYGPSPKSAEDPRLTTSGKWLREHSLDELPQLWNVLVGNMSLVGPRPLYSSQIDEWNETQKQRLNVKPGLTGLAQISGRGELTIEQKLNLDVEYINKRSFGFDLKILFITAAQVFSKKAIYEVRYSEKEKTRGESEV